MPALLGSDDMHIQTQKRLINNQEPCTSLSRNEITKLHHDAKVVGECYRVRILFDTDANKNDPDYISIIEDTWIKTFTNTNPEILQEAVHNFIVSDKNGFLPKPGQIIEYLVKGVKIIEKTRYYKSMEVMERQFLESKLSQ